MKISPHFTKEEFSCRCGCEYQPDIPTELLRVLEDMRESFNKPITINSGYRCYSYNKQVGGAPHSQHLTGKASDIVIKDIKPDIVQDYLLNKYPKLYGIGRYTSFTHIDVRAHKARW